MEIIPFTHLSFPFCIHKCALLADRRKNNSSVPRYILAMDSLDYSSTYCVCITSTHPAPHRLSSRKCFFFSKKEHHNNDDAFCKMSYYRMHRNSRWETHVASMLIDVLSSANLCQRYALKVENSKLNNFSSEPF